MRAAVPRLDPVSDTPRLDADLLMAEALGVSRSELLLRHMGQPVPARFAALVERRAAAEPVAYIIGRREFYGLDLAVTPDVLIPRWDSECLIEAARRELERHPPRRVLDLGTGSGALLLAALSLWDEARGLGTDRSPAALAVAEGNARRIGFAARTRWLAADWNTDGWDAGLGPFDLILANPPYVETGAALARGVRNFEPHGALFAGDDGLDAYKVLIPQVPRLLARGGVAMVEIGATQAEAVAALAAAAGLYAGLERDLAGLPRAMLLKIGLA